MLFWVWSLILMVNDDDGDVYLSQTNSMFLNWSVMVTFR